MKSSGLLWKSLKVKASLDGKKDQLEKVAALLLEKEVIEAPFDLESSDLVVKFNLDRKYTKNSTLTQRSLLPLPFGDRDEKKDRSFGFNHNRNDYHAHPLPSGCKRCFSISAGISIL